MNEDPHHSDEVREPPRDERNDLGDLQVDRRGGKSMGAGGGGGGSYLDPSYEMALRILGREGAIPSPFEQRALTMSDAEAADLSRSLTRLQMEAGLLQFANVRPADEVPAVGEFIAELQVTEPDRSKLRELADQIGGLGPEVRGAFDEVVRHSAVQAKLVGSGSIGPSSDPTKLPRV
jgi:hypothetical protein